MNTQAQFCRKHMSKIWCKNFHAFMRYCDFRVGIFFWIIL